MTEIPQNITVSIDGKEYSAVDISINITNNFDHAYDAHGKVILTKITSTDYKITSDGLKEKGVKG